MKFPKISIVTPNYNMGAFLEQTILSVISQNYPNLEYIVVDGGSTDGSVEIIRRYEKQLTWWVSEKDGGMYDALRKGFSRSTGEIMGWINSDDLLHRNSLYILANIFANINSVNWIQGHPTVYDETGMIVFSRDAIYSKYHFFLKKYRTSGEFIQQESTFWRRSLWEKAGGFIAQEYKYAGDFELWMRFYKYDLLFYTKALIGGFRVKENQLSKIFYDKYLQECDLIVDRLFLNNQEIDQIQRIKFIERLLIKTNLFSNYFNRKLTRLYGLQNPVNFNFDTGKFKLDL